MAPAGEPGGDQGVRPARIRAADRRQSASSCRSMPEPDGRRPSGAGTSRSAAPSASDAQARRRSGRSRWPSHAADFRELRLDRLEPRLRRRSTRSTDVTLDDPARRVHRPARPLRLRQVDGAQLHRRPAAVDRRRHLARRAAASTAAPGGARLRHGVPELRAVPAHERAQEYRLRPDDAAACRRPRPTRRVDEALALVRLQGQGDKLPGQLSGGQQQRVAIARAIVDRAAAGADGRAALQPRRQAAARDARRDPPHPRHARLDHHLRHARPGRGAVARRPHRRAARRRRSARSARRRSSIARPGASRCRRVHGLPQPARTAASSPSTAAVSQRRRRRRAARAARAREPLQPATTAVRRDPARGSRRRRPTAPDRRDGRVRSNIRGRDFFGFGRGRRRQPSSSSARA